MKKILVGLMAIALVIGMLGVGTIATFFDVETSTGNQFAAGTLNLTLGSSSPLPIVLREMAPGVESAGQTIVMTNTGSLPGRVTWEITSVADSDGSTGTPANNVNVSAADFAVCVVVSDVYFDRNDNDNLNEPGGTNVVSNYAHTATGITPSPLTRAAWASLTAVQRQAVINAGTWAGAPGGIDDEWVLPDWIRWGDMLNGNNDGKLTIGEIDAMAPGSWNIDDLAGTPALDPGQSYTHVLKFTLDDSLYTGGNVNNLQADGITVTVTVTLNQV